VAYELELRTGVWRRRLPADEWAAHALADALADPALADPPAYLAYRRERAPSFLFAPADRARYAPLLRAWDAAGPGPAVEADALAGGRVRFFAHAFVETGFPPAWHRDPGTGADAPAARHWSAIPDFGPADVKTIWEPSRFAFVYALVRAYWRTADERYPSLFWRATESWRAANPPQQGPNWKCGQEISLRLMAWCFGLHGFLDSPATTPERVVALAQTVAVSAARVEANLDYALRQQNNHGISECLGLWTAAVLFPELRGAPRWRALARRHLERQAATLIYDDGAFSQHSVNYQRLMLDAYLWCLRLGDLNAAPLGDALRERVGRAGALLYALQDEATGCLPYYGQNDGALALPLANADYHDFRPVVQATQALTRGSRAYPPGPWDEQLLWLAGPAAIAAPLDTAPRADLRAPVGGYYTLRAPTGFAFTRCAAYRHRPGQADLLHVDLWWRGHNVARDAGTFRYNAPPPWDNALAGTAYHNTVGVDGRDQMDRAGPFLWLPWARGRVRCQARSPAGHLAYWEGSHDGYHRLADPIEHTRAVVQLGPECWLVLDDLRGRREHHYRLHWLLPDWPYDWLAETRELTLHSPAGPYNVRVAGLAGACEPSLVRADPASPRGWRAPYYGHREPALSLSVAWRARGGRVASCFGPSAPQIMLDGATLCVQADGWQARLRLDPSPAAPLVAAVDLRGSLEDRLEPPCTYS
jgi:asparagine synthase (glutamine-hydrolysing)